MYRILDVPLFPVAHQLEYLTERDQDVQSWQLTKLFLIQQKYLY